MADIEIRIKGKDDASDELKTVTKAIEKLDKATEQASSSAGTSGDKWDSLMTSFTGINQAVQLAQQAFQALQQVYDVVITQTVAYAEQVRQLSRAIGSTPEDASKLIQAADDVKVSFESLQTGMNIAIRNGLEPTIEGMGKLADEYVAIEDPIKRTEFLLKSFGRSGADLAPLMELGADGIRELGEAAEETGLVLNQEALDATRNYEKAIDSLQDSWAGFVTQIGIAVIPAINSVIEAMNQEIKVNSSFYDALEKLNKARKDGVIDEGDYIVAKKELVKATTSGVDELEKYAKVVDMVTDAYKAAGRSASWTTAETDALVMSIFEGADSWDEFVAAMYIAGVDLGMMTEDLFNAEKGADGLGSALGRVSASSKDFSGVLGILSKETANIVSIDKNFGGIVNLAKGFTTILDTLKETETQIKELDKIKVSGGMFEGVWMSASQVKAKIAELVTETGVLKGEMESLANQMVLNMFAAQIAIGGITEAELTAYMDMAVRMGEISREAADTAIDEFQRAVDFINEYEIKDRYFTIWGTVVWPSMSGPGGTSMGGSGSGGKEQPVQRSAGGIINAAAGAFGKQAYYVGEIGPELFFPSQDGRILSNSETKAALRSGRGGGETINVTINTPVNFADKAFVERELAPYIKSVMKDALRT